MEVASNTTSISSLGETTTGVSRRRLTHAHPVVDGHSKAVVADTLVAALDVHTLAVAADVGDLQALVAV